jgi:hypothetical protein
MDYLQAAKTAWEETDKQRRFRMIGDSMSPFIQDGDGVVIEHDTAEIRVGDVILYPKPSASSLGQGFVLHRVVRVIADGPQRLFVTQGDNRPLPDPPVASDQILGKVAEVEKTEGLSPEDRLLLCCARTEMDEGTIEEVRELLDGELDWAYLLAAAIRHAIPQLLYHNLLAQGAAIGAERMVPPGVLSRLEQMYYANALRHLRFGRALEEMLGAFKEIGIEAIVLKGMALATQVYPVAALRQCGDIDVLVRKEDLLRAEEVLLGLGYTVPGQGLPSEWFGQRHRHLPYVKDEGRIRLEVHWTLVPPDSYHLPPSELWARAQPLRIGSSETWALDPADLLLHLSVHAVPLPNLLWGQDIDLRHLCDIAETIRVYPLDWDQLIVRARNYRVTRCLYVALHLARRMLQARPEPSGVLSLSKGRKARVPHDVLEVLQPTDVDPRWLADLEERVMKRRPGSTEIPPKFVRLLSAQGVFNKLRVLRGILFPPPSAIARARGLSWTSREVYWYYLTRPFHLLSRWGGFVLRFLIRERWEGSLYGVRSSDFSRSDSVEGD